MGMNYNATFHNATIKPEKYGKLIDWAPEDVAAEPEKAAQIALEVVEGYLDEFANEPEQDAEGIHLDGCGYYDSASYGYLDELFRLLRFCEPGAYIHDIDAEEMSGEQWRHYLLPGGVIRTVRPEVVWPEVVIA